MEVIDPCVNFFRKGPDHLPRAVGDRNQRSRDADVAPRGLGALGRNEEPPPVASGTAYGRHRAWPRYCCHADAGDRPDRERPRRRPHAMPDGRHGRRSQQALHGGAARRTIGALTASTQRPGGCRRAHADADLGRDPARSDSRPKSRRCARDLLGEVITRSLGTGPVQPAILRAAAQAGGCVPDQRALCASVGDTAPPAMHAPGLNSEAWP